MTNYVMKEVLCSILSLMSQMDSTKMIPLKHSGVELMSASESRMVIKQSKPSGSRKLNN